MPIHKTQLLLVLITLWITACAPNSPTPVDSFTPPTIAAPPTLVGAISPTAPALTPTPTCANYLRYLDDVTIPDGTVTTPGVAIDKRWLVENSGNCNWDATYTLRLITGPDLGAASPQPLYPAIAGTQFELRISYTAPNESGIYRSAWQAYDANEQPFGDPVFIEIVVP